MHRLDARGTATVDWGSQRRLRHLYCLERIACLASILKLCLICLYMRSDKLMSVYLVD